MNRTVSALLALGAAVAAAPALADEGRQRDIGGALHQSCADLGANPEVPATWSATRTRPLCPYPKLAVYRGGDVESAASFACR